MRIQRVLVWHDQTEKKGSNPSLAEKVSMEEVRAARSLKVIGEAN